MRKIFALLTLISVVLSICSCGVKNTEPKKDNSSDASSASSTSEEPKTIQTAVAKELFDRNLKCTLEIFDLKTLDYEETAVKDTLFPVKDDRFKTFSDLEEYVKATYIDDVANRLLYEPRYEEHKLYQDVDGVFCIDTTVIGGKGYYVDWENYDIKVVSGDESEAEIEVTATIEEPSDNPTKEPYVKTATAKNINGNWLLTEVVY